MTEPGIVPILTVPDIEGLDRIIATTEPGTTPISTVPDTDWLATPALATEPPTIIVSNVPETEVPCAIVAVMLLMTSTKTVPETEVIRVPPWNATTLPGITPISTVPLMLGLFVTIAATLPDIFPYTELPSIANTLPGQVVEATATTEVFPKIAMTEPLLICAATEPKPVPWLAVTVPEATTDPDMFP
jgi:hypothetical protein